MLAANSVLLLLVLFTPGCYGDEYFSHLVLLDELPAVFGTNATPDIVIRTNYSGEIEFRESESFKVLLNISAPRIEDAYAVNSELVEDDGKLLLQVFQKPVSEATVPLKWIFIVIGCLGGLVMLLTIVYSIYWYTRHRDLLYNRNFNASMYRSRSLGGPATADLLGDFVDDVFESPDGGDVDDRSTRKLEKLRVTLKPETIMEESEESADDDRTSVKRYQTPSKQWTLKLTNNPLANENLSGSGLLDYPDQSGDELDNDRSPERRIAVADGCYTPMDEVDDFLHEQESEKDKMKIAKSIGKLPDPRGNLDINIHQSKSDGDLIDDRHKKMSERNKSITPLTVNPPEQKRVQNIEMKVRRAEPNVYQRGLNLKPPENDLSGYSARDSPARDSRTRVQIHTPEKFDNSTGQYVALQLPQDQRSRSRGSRESNDAFELYTYPADIPLSTFKSPETPVKRESPAQFVPKVKPKPLYATGSPTGFEYQNLNSNFKPVDSKDKAPVSPGSPGNFSMLSEGSSGDYDDDEHGHILELDDSDLEISPPGHDGDMISNASLPLPSPPPIAKIGGYDVTATISQLSPRQSLVMPEDSGKDYGTVIALTGSPSPGGPYSKHSVGAGPDGNRFVFPPPPMMHSTPQQVSWSRRELFRDDTAGEYIGLDAPGMPRSEEQPAEERQRDRRKSGERVRRVSGERERRMSGGRKKGKPPSLHLAIVGSLCLLSILTGVYSTSSSETSVKIIVYVPSNYPYKNATIYSSLPKTVDVLEDKKGDTEGMNWFVSENPVLLNLGSKLCENTHCKHGCDENTGNCICKHGFKMTADGCEDVNECQQGGAKCPNKKAGCVNTEGSYECLCSGKDLYENFEGECRDCSKPCSPGTYEDLPCKGEQKKICRECTKTCSENQYMKDACSAKRDINCKTCQPKCDATLNEYEYSQCSATQNRECKDRDVLPPPFVSENVVLEDLMAVDDAVLYIDTEYEGTPSFSLRRGNTRGLNEKIRLDVSSESSARQRIHMKIKPYFHGKENFSGWNSFGTMKISSRQEKFELIIAPETINGCTNNGGDSTSRIQLYFNSSTIELSAKDLYCEADKLFLKKIGFGWHVKGKGSDFWIDTEIKHFQPVAHFRPVNHSVSMDKRDYPGSPAFLQSECPYPVPSYYQLFYKVHQNVSYKGNPMDDPNSLKACQGELSNFPDLNNRTMERSVICSEPGFFSNVFKMNASYYTQTATEWLEKNDRCRREHEACENCTGACGLEMIKNSDQCSVNVNDDNGRSPRLPLCFTCCVRRQCGDLCKFYHDDRCRMERCNRGNLVQFLLSPVYAKPDEYYCHVEQDPHQLLLQIEYTVNLYFQQQRSVLYAGNMSVYGNEDWQKTGRVFKSDGLIDVEIDSELKEIPDFIFSAVGTRVKAGMYRPTGAPLPTSGVEEPLVNIRPLKPFGIDKKSFGSKTCNDEVFKVKDVVKATVTGGLFQSMHKELVSVFRNGSYLIRNKTAEPNMKFRLPKTTSILKAIYPPTRLKFNSLSGNMTYNRTHWIVMVTGELETCPGFLHLNLSDPSYPKSAIYQFAVGVTCQNPGFFINFSVPTGDSAMISKMFQIKVKDSNSTYQLMIYAPATETWTLKKVSRRVPVAKEVTSLSAPSSDSHTISTLFIAVVSGATLVLLFLLLFGVAWRQGIPKGSYLMFRSRHLAMLVIYITFQFVYALVASMTVFVLITIAVNGETTAFLKQYKLQRSVKTALSQLELDQMEVHMKAELLHLNSVAQQRKTNCENNIRTVMDDVNKLAREIEEEVMSKVKKQNIKDLVTNHTKNVVEQFSRDLLKFRDKYDKYEKFLKHKLSTEVESTYNSVQRSEWLLRGARFIHSFVFNIRTFQHSGATTLPFMEWANLETNMTQLANGLLLPLPDLPVLGFNPTAANPSAPSKNHISNPAPVATETRNQWFIQPSLVPEFNKTGSESARNQQEEKPVLDTGSYMIFFICMICIDILMLLHRMIKAGGTGKLLLYGYPIYVDARDQKLESTPDEKKPLNNNLGRQICKSVIDKMLSTYFIPKLIGTIFVTLMVVFVLLVSSKFVNRETFQYLGYYNNIEDLMKINENVINSRIRTHAKLINDIEYPMYEQVMNVHIQRHQHILSLVESQWRAVEESQTRAYCTYLRRINVSAECAVEQKDTSILGVKVDGCLFPPVLPQLYHRDRATSSKIAESQLDQFLSKIQNLISDTCLVIIIYLAIITIKELLGTVLWIYFKRSGFVSLRIIYETDEPPESSNASAK